MIWILAFIEIYLLHRIFGELRLLRKAVQSLNHGVRIIPVASRLAILIDGKKVKHMNIQDSGQVAQLALIGEDAAGNPAPLDPQSAPVWSIDDSSLGALSVDPVLGQIFTPSGKLGTVNISVSIPAVNAQPALAGTGSLSVIPGSAVQVALQISAVAAPAPAAPVAAAEVKKS